MRITSKAYLKRIATETARMSFPGRMGGILAGGAKDRTEEFFVNEFCIEIELLWQNPGRVARSFDTWHQRWTNRLARILRRHVKKAYRSQAVASKLMNTFLYQLIKYRQLNALYPHLHLPLDQQVFRSLRALARNNDSGLAGICDVVMKNPYRLSYKEYSKVQAALGKLLREYDVKGIKLESKIQLNALLWRRIEETA